MGLEEDFGLFQRTGQNGRIIKGKPKRKLRRIVTRPVGFLLSPITREAKKRARKKIKKGFKKAFEEPDEIKISVKEALEMEKKERKINLFGG